MATAETDQIVAELSGAVEALGQARQQTAAAAGHAGQIAARAAGAGFEGVAMTMGGIRDQITALAAAIADVEVPGKVATSAVRGVGAQSSPNEAHSYLSMARQKVDALRQGVLAAVQRAEAIKGRVDAALRGAEPGPMLARLDGIRRLLITAGQRANGANARIATAMATGSHLGN